MNEETFTNQEDEELFNEFLLLQGFKVVATKNMSSLPENKPAILLQTENNMLFKALKKWAWHNDVIMLYNPEQYDYEIFQKFYAYVIDSDFIKMFPFPELLKEKYIKAELEFDLLKSILTDLKNYGNKKI